MIGLAGHGHGRGYAHKHQHRGHQKAAANAKQSRYKTHDQAQRDQ